MTHIYAKLHEMHSREQSDQITGLLCRLWNHIPLREQSVCATSEIPLERKQASTPLNLGVVGTVYCPIF